MKAAGRGRLARWRRPWNFLSDCLRGCLLGREGSITLESALIMPLIFLLTVSFLFAALYVYEHAKLQHAVSDAVLRAASAWSCCGGQGTTVQTEQGGQGLYWRWWEGTSWNWLTGTGLATDGREVEVPKNGFVPQTSVERKLLLAAREAPPEASGSFRFNSGLVLSTVEGSLAELFRLPTWLRQPERVASAAARSSVVEPVEWMRNISLVRHYAGELRSRFLDRESAERKVREFLELHSPGTFARHSEAAAYLRRLVSGREHMVELSGSRRLIDALTSNGVAHQAYLTFTEKQIREQMAKDVEMLQQGGEVSGVVWHFFRRTGQTGRVGPSDKLLEDLYRNGIVVVIHD
jgi:hypothetical protein